MSWECLILLSGIMDSPSEHHTCQNVIILSSSCQPVIFLPACHPLVIILSSGQCYLPVILPSSCHPVILLPTYHCPVIQSSSYHPAILLPPVSAAHFRLPDESRSPVGGRSEQQAVPVGPGGGRVELLYIFLSLSSLLSLFSQTLQLIDL